MKREVEEILLDLKKYPGLEKSKLEEIQKKRLYNLTMQKIQKEKLVQKEIPEKKTVFFRKKPIRRFVVVALAAVFMCAAVLGCKTAFHYSDSIQKYFGKVKKEKITMDGEKLNISETCEKTTVRVKEVVGDAYGCYIRYQIDNETISQPLDAENLEITIPAESYTVLDPKLVSCQDGCAEYVVGIRTSEKLNTMDAKFALANPGYQKGNKFVIENKHTFRLKVPLYYSDNAIEEIKVNKKISIYGGSGILSKVSISPLSVTVFLEDLNDTKVYGSQLAPGESLNNRLRILLKDGTVIDSENPSKDYDLYDDTDVISMGFRDIISKEEIESIEFAGVLVYTDTVQK